MCPGSVNSTLPDVTASVSNMLPPGLLLDPGFLDDASIPDLVFTYNGPDFQVSGGPYPTIVNFAGLSALSSFSSSTTGSFSAMAVKNNGAETGSATFNVGEVSVPSAVPEPSTWAMFLTGFLGLGLMLRRRGRKAPMVLSA